jgi:hypothetical protein
MRNPSEFALTVHLAEENLLFGVKGGVERRPARQIPRAPGAAALRVELAPNVSIAISIELPAAVSISLADVAAIRAAAAPLIAELARRQLALHAEGDDV